MEPTGNYSLSEAVRKSYRAGEEDETLQPLVARGRNGAPFGRIGKGDAVIFYNIRGEREIELTRSLTEKGFAEFPTTPDLGLAYATMIEYRRTFPWRWPFPPKKPWRIP